MRYCPTCQAEYQETVSTCADCGTALVERGALEPKPEPARVGKDVGALVRAGECEDPLTAQRWLDALGEAGIVAYARPRRFGTVDVLTSGSTHPWWELFVAQSELARAQELIARAQADVAGAEGSLPTV